MFLKDYLDVEKLEKYVTEGIVDARRHSNLPLTIYCYSRRATYEDIWDEITEKTRGLIVADSGRIVSRPFEKFFNVSTLSRPETHISNLPFKQPFVMEKLDGSLGILWEYEGITGVASKGSFQSDHSRWATEWYFKHCQNPQWPAGYTPVFEMICQSVQRHVVIYDIPDQLILLALIHNETGEELSYNELHFYAGLNGLATAQIYAKSLGDTLEEDRENREGYVLSWERPGRTPLKVKVKHETFLKLQKIVHAATPKAILEALMSNQHELIQTWIASANPDLTLFVNDWSSRFIEAFGRHLHNAGKLVQNAKLRSYDRKECAEFFLQPENKMYSSLCFALLDEGDSSKAAWKLVQNTFKDELTRPVLGDPYDDLDEVEPSKELV